MTGARREGEGWVSVSVMGHDRPGIVFGLSAVLFGEITLQNGRVEQGTFDDYSMLRISGMPEVEVHIISSTEAPSGIREPGVPPIAAAVTNAIFAATGRRIRRLPIGTVGKKMCEGGDAMI